MYLEFKASSWGLGLGGVCWVVVTSSWISVYLRHQCVWDVLCVCGQGGWGWSPLQQALVHNPSPPGSPPPTLAPTPWPGPTAALLCWLCPLQDYLEGILVVVSHDRAFLNNVTTDIVHLYK